MSAFSALGGVPGFLFARHHETHVDQFVRSLCRRARHPQCFFRMSCSPPLTVARTKFFPAPKVCPDAVMALSCGFHEWCQVSDPAFSSRATTSRPGGRNSYCAICLRQRFMPAISGPSIQERGRPSLDPSFLRVQFNVGIDAFTRGAQ